MFFKWTCYGSIRYVISGISEDIQKCWTTTCEPNSTCHLFYNSWVSSASYIQMDCGRLEQLFPEIPESVDEHSHRALCLSSFAETVWPAEPTRCTAKLVYRPSSIPREGQWPPCWWDLSSFDWTPPVKKAQFLGICFQEFLAVIIK